MPHARLGHVELGPARDAPGVEGVFSADDLGLAPLPPAGNVESGGGELEGVFGREVLARDVVRFVGEPFAMIVADSLAHALDAAEQVTVDYEPLGVVVGPEAALTADAPLLFPSHGSNVAHAFGLNPDDDVLDEAEVVVAHRFVNQRLAPAPMETNGIAVEPHVDGTFTVWVSTQVPFDVRDDVAEALGVDRTRVRTIAPDVGGGFGAKLQIYPEYLATARAAQILGRSVRWSELRSESMLGLTHGRAQVQHVRIGARRDGVITGLQVEIVADMGAYPIGAYLPVTTQEMLSGVYAIPRISCRGRSVVTNATPVAPYRGAGRPEATALIERAIDLLAAELALDPVDVRRRNLIPSDAFPYTTSSGMTYDTGDYAMALDVALDRAGLEQLRADQAARRARGDHLQLGVGVSTYVEITSFSSKEYGSVEVHEDGSATVLSGVTSNGQGHETAFAQIASAILAIEFDRVRVIHSDTGIVPRGAGTWGSRSLQVGGSAVAEQATAVLELGRALAADLLEADPGDVMLADGRWSPVGIPDRSVGWGEIATVSLDPTRRPADLPQGLRAEGRYREPGSTFPFGAHVSVVEVDVETGAVRLVRHVAVDDCGRILNPALVLGQVHGGLGQGIAQALFERMDYDEHGNPVTGTLSTYGFPSAAEFCAFECENPQTVTPLNPLGAKGIGESACIGSTPAVINAAVDALSPWGVRHLDPPLDPESVLSAIRTASAATGA